MIIYNRNDVNENKKAILFLKTYIPGLFQLMCKCRLKKNISQELGWWKKHKDKNPIFCSIEIETINRCNNDCSFCPVNIHAEKRELKKMEDSMFHKIIRELSEMDYQGGVNLFSNNEPLIDERIVEFAKVAKEKLPNAKINLFTNGILLNEDIFYKIINYLDYLQVDNYNNDMVIYDNLSFLVDIMEKDKAINEKVRIIVMQKNVIRSTRGGESPNNKKKKSIDCGCILPFHQIIIRPDGKVSLCCNDAYGQHTLGDLSKNTLLEIWNSAEYANVRKMIAHDRKSIDICKYCDNLDMGRR